MEGHNYKNSSTKMDLINMSNGKHEQITLNAFKNRVKRGTITLIENDKSPFDRWLSKQDRFVQNCTTEEQKQTYNEMQKYVKQLSKKKNFIIHISNDNHLLCSLIEAFKIVRPRMGNYNIRLTFNDNQGHVYYRILNQNTINYLNDLLYNDKYEIKDSFDDFVHTVNEIQKINIEFTTRKLGKRINPGFFPYINISDIDMTRYGIFNSIEDILIENSNESSNENKKMTPINGKFCMENNKQKQQVRTVRELHLLESNKLLSYVNESCLIQSIRASGVLTKEELLMLKSFVKTRTVPQTILNEISKLFKVHINCKIIYNFNVNHLMKSYKVSLVDFGTEFKESRSIKLIIINSHYILNEKVNISECYIMKYEQINNDVRFKNHPRKMTLLKFDPKRYSFSKKSMKIFELIQLMIEYKLLVPMSEKQMNQLEWSFKSSPFDSFDSISRKIIIEDKSSNENHLMKSNKLISKHFFGYTPDQNEVEFRLKELQNVIDSLPLRKRVDVSLYYKFSELMQKIMYEFGCFDGVLEFCGKKAQSIREQCVFPHSHTYNYKPLYLRKKLYYIDLIGAYLAGIDGIPIGEDFKEKNTKIKQLIEILYNIRMDAKNNSNTKLATTLKFMMNSCWGYSIRRPKTIKHKYTNNVDNYIDTFAPYVIGYNYVNNESGYVSTVNSFVPYFTTPQFAKEVLDNFNKKIDEISNIVNIYYYNIDAILIDENDYNKLVNLGYIGDELGKFKIEHIFTEIAIKSAKQYVSKLEDGTKFYHCSKNTDYDDFVNDVKKICM